MPITIDRRYLEKSNYINTSNNGVIYMILNNITGGFYIGSSIRYRNRWSAHIHLLNNNKHHNRHLQNSWNKHGSKNFTFNVLVSIFNNDEIFEVEEYYLRYYFKYFKKDIYNHTDKAVKILGSGNIKGSLNPKSKLNEKQVLSIREEFKEMDGLKRERYDYLSNKYDVSSLTISRIIRNKLWKNI